MIINYRDFVIELIDDKYHTLNSVDNINTYTKTCSRDTTSRINSQHGIKVSENNIEISSALVCSDGLSTTVHSTSYFIKNDIIFLCCGKHLYALDIPTLQIKWFKELDPATCFEIYPFEDDFIIHGEITISRITALGEIKWEFSARDIFVNLNGHKEFEIINGQIKIIDFENYEYILDGNGKIISDRLLK
jgi:hypothetical protein